MHHTPGIIRAIIFDLDGTLANTEALHFAAFREVLRPLGISLEREDYFARLIGFNDHDCFTTVLEESRYGVDDRLISELIARKAERYQATIAVQDVLYPGAAEFVRECAKRFPLILVTGTLRAEAEMILRRAQIRDCFLDLIAAENVAHGKPAPDGFLAALGRLGFLLRPHPSISPAECLAIEDTVAGIEAARQAGMRVLAVAQTASLNELSTADLIRPSLNVAELDELLRQFAKTA